MNISNIFVQLLIVKKLRSYDQYTPGVPRADQYIFNPEILFHRIILILNAIGDRYAH
jgi:hypothetical protein